MRFYLFSLCILINYANYTNVWASPSPSKAEKCSQKIKLKPRTSVQRIKKEKVYSLTSKKIKYQEKISSPKKKTFFDVFFMRRNTTSTASKSRQTNEASRLSRYGNPDVYLVKGCPYRVMKNAAGYKVKGIASWYGGSFHRQKTSSGETYDMYAMTAAHKTLPLPTYVRVKNLHNGREVVVKVNDRGPFYKNRIIDLSYAASAKLGFLTEGTALVEVEALPQRKEDASYYVQAGAFSSPHMATSLQNKIAKLTSSPVKIEKYQAHYIVRVGPFSNKKLTDHLKKKMASQGIQGAFSLLL